MFAPPNEKGIKITSHGKLDSIRTGNAFKEKRTS